MNRKSVIGVLLTVCATVWLLGAGPGNVPSRHYRVSGDLDTPRARALAGHMDAVFDEFGKRFASFPAKNSKQFGLHLFASEEAYLEFLRGKGFDASNTAGIFFFIGGEAGLATFIDGQAERRMLHTLQHEGFHQFAHVRIGESLPIWANEGLAEYFGEAILVRRVLRTGVAPEGRLVVLRERLRRGDGFPLEVILEMSNEEWSALVTGGDPRAGLLYDQAWSMAHFLVHAKNGLYADAFVVYLRAISEGAEPADAFARAFRGTPAEMDKAWQTFVLEEWQADPIGTAAERLEFIAEGIGAFAQEGQSLTSIGQLQSWMQERGMVLTRTQHGVSRATSSMDDDNFRAPCVPGTRRQPTLELTPPDRESRLPGARVTGLEAMVTLVWVRAGDGFQPEIRFH